MAQAINEEFNPWSGNVSPDGVWQLAGNWFGTGNNQFGLSRETLTSTHAGETDTGFLNLTITPSTKPDVEAKGSTSQNLAKHSPKG